MNRLKRIYLSLLAVLLSPIAANADIIEISGSVSSDGLWDITFIEESYTDNQALLETQEWWGDPALAMLFADALGYVNWVDNFGFGIGPMFLYLVDGNLFFSAWTDGSLFPPEGSKRFIAGDPSASRVYATASRIQVTAESRAIPDLFVTPVPEPTTIALLGLGLVGMAARRRKKV